MLRYLENVVTLELNTEACNGCGMCVNVCPYQVVSFYERKAVITDKGACMECGAYAINCPVNAIQVRPGVGCASAILLGMVGKKSECSSERSGLSASTDSKKNSSGTAAK